ncbi:MAG: glycosyltransferase family 2 protein [Phycisphaeraceae bacterium]|jgi:glycosyltransferase involved in cell wall biosynthesis|nr:glycosyltransferase family 2 protein [Phycisphaeraceae bacterium]MDP7347270.1 glycosyltransferase family 2 protein [Phycisphaeraceae bacterium]
MVKVSVAICCANAGATLRSACESVRWADELLIIDSGSHDNTAAIAQEYADRYVVEPWRGYTLQKQYAADLSQHDWVLIIDGDEECSPVLGEQIRALDDAQFEAVDLVTMPRRNYVMGRYVRAWSPDRQRRLFHRHRVVWKAHTLHDSRGPSAPRRIMHLTGWIEHKRHSDAGFDDYFSGARHDARLQLVARDWYAQGKRCHWWDLVLRPYAAFIKFYLCKGGFLAGTFGLLIAQKAAVSTQLRYAALWAAQAESKIRKLGKSNVPSGKSAL